MYAIALTLYLFAIPIVALVLTVLVVVSLVTALCAEPATADRASALTDTVLNALCRILNRGAAK